ncbi:MAG: hypothetical protein RLZZ352_2731 [Pseudomonadota bacterium]|jgi:hypothetical protein
MTFRAALLAVSLTLGVTVEGFTAEPSAPLPSFAALEAAGTRFGTIRVVPLDIFDTTDPQENKRLFRLANWLHIQTRPGVVDRALLFQTGDPVSVRVLEETERLLRSASYLSDVRIRPVAVRGDVVDVEVETRDTWSIEMGASVGRTGGANSSGLRLRDYNLLGTGVMMSIGQSKTVDRSGTEFEFANERALGTRTAIRLSHATNSDGQRDMVSVANPFYALDKRWAAGVKLSRDDRIDSLYTAGNVSGQYRHQESQAELSGGWSAGLINGWVNRYSVGLSRQEDVYSLVPGAPAPATLPSNQTLVAPFLRFERVQDRFEKELNRNLVGRPEYFALGLNVNAQIGRASKRLGSTDDAWTYSASISRGFEPQSDHTLMVAANLRGQFSNGQTLRQRAGVQAQYYRPQSPRWLFYAAMSMDTLTHPNPDEVLSLGGDNGLRGYPLRYQNGTRRALFTVEERFYTDLYLWRLFRVGGAAYLDTGRAWGGTDAGTGADTGTPQWLSNVGAGLRIISTRSAFSNVLHVDLAFPLNAPPDVKRLQFLVKSKTSF